VKFKRKVREEQPINMTPLIDVVFLLLIFFMVTTTFTRETRLSVSLPEAEATEARPDNEHIEIVVSQNGSYSIDGRTLVNSQIETLMQGLEEVAAGRRDIPVLLVADSLTTHQAVVTAMDGIGQLGFAQLSIATQRPGEGDNNSQ